MDNSKKVKFIRKNGKIIPIKKPEGGPYKNYAKAREKGLMTDADAMNHVKMKNKTVSEWAKDSLKLTGFLGTVGATLGLLGGLNKKSALAGGAIGLVSGMANTKGYDERATIRATEKEALKRLKKAKKGKK